MPTTTGTQAGQDRSFDNVITEPTPFSEGRRVRLDLLRRKGPDKATYLGPENVIFHVERGSDGKYVVMYF